MSTSGRRRSSARSAVAGPGALKASAQEQPRSLRSSPGAALELPWECAKPQSPGHVGNPPRRSHKQDRHSHTHVFIWQFAFC